MLSGYEWLQLTELAITGLSPAFEEVTEEAFALNFFS
jgi:hypothetical protein